MTSAKPMTCTSTEFYGHGHVLRTYAGLPNRPIRGRVQHGWTPGEWEIDDLVRRGEPVFVWSQRDARGLKRGCEASRPIPTGAPYLYSESPLLPLAPPRGVVSFPHHSLNRHVLKDAPRWESYAKDFRAWAESEGLLPACACLHIRDCEREEAPRAFERNGVMVTTCGDAMSPRFLGVFDRIASQFAVATSNRVSTAIFYCLFLGRACVVRGDPMLCDPPDILEEETGSPGWLHEHFPALLTLGENKELASRELGLENMKKPQELAALLELF